MTIEEGAVGERIGTAEQTDVLGDFVCEELLTLTAVEDGTLVVDAKRGPRGTAVCGGDTTGLRFGPVEDGLRYVSRDARAGNPTGTPTKRR
ncbi:MULTISPECIES: hypothetical protein [unclassified Streptomyces]|uniref:hypothetical protein n=1 Tax=unclassified Streptomyces TaxID=2593676 RepID=UPI0037F93FC0